MSRDQVHEGTILYLIRGIDMFNHSHDDDAINTELMKCKDCTSVELGDGRRVDVEGYFAMKAGECTRSLHRSCSSHCAL